MNTENILRIKLELTQDGQLKATLVDTVQSVQDLDTAQKAAAESAVAMAQAEQGVAAAVSATAESTSDADTRIKDMVRSSLERVEAEREVQQASAATSRANAVASTEYERTIAWQTQWSNATTALMREQQKASDAKAVVANVEAQRAALGKLVGQIDPTVAALEKLDIQQAKLSEFKKAGLLGEDDFGRLNSAIDESRSRINAAGEAMSHFSLNNSFARRELGRLASDMANGNWGRFEQTSLTLANASGLLSSAFSATGAAIAAVVAPIGLFIAAVIKGYLEDQKLNDAIIATGNYAGTTASEMHQMAENISATAGTVGKASDALAGMLQSGRFTADQMTLIGTAALAMSEATGRSVESIIGDFTKLSEEPLKASEKLNEQYHYLTLAVYDQIKALQDQGDKQAAADLAEKTYADAMQQRSEAIQKNLGTLQRAWRDLAVDASRTWDAMLGAGRDQTLADKLQDLGIQYESVDEQIRKMQKQGMTNGGFLNGGNSLDSYIQWREKLRQQIADVQAQMSGDTDKAREQGALRQQETDSVNASAYYDQHFGKLSKLSDKQRELNDLTKTYQTMWDNNLHGDNPRLADVTRDASGNFHGGQYDTDVAGVNAKFNKGANAEAKAALSEQVQAVKDAYALINDQYTNSEKVLAAQNKSGQLSNKDYYDSLEVMYQQQANFQIESLQKQNEILSSTKASGAERINLDKQIAKNKEEMEKIQQDAIAKTQEAEAHRMDGLKQLNNAMTSMLVQSESYTALRDRQNARQISAAGLGSDARQLNTQLEQIENTYERFKDTLTRDAQKSGLIDSDQFKRDIQTIDQLEQQELDREKQRYAERLQLTETWQVGAARAFGDVMSSGQNMANGMASAITGGFNDMTNAVVQFANTGKFSLESFAQNFIDAVIRMEVQALEAKAASSMLSWMGFGGGGGGGGGFMSLGGSAGDYSGIGSSGSFGGSFDFSAGGYADGGAIKGPGTGTSDSILIRASNGEYMQTADAHAHYGTAFMDAIRDKRLPRFATGGAIGSTFGSSGAAAPQIVVNNNNGSQVDARSEQKPDGRWITTLIIDTVTNDLVRGGRSARAMEQRYGVARRGTPV